MVFIGSQMYVGKAMMAANLRRMLRAFTHCLAVAVCTVCSAQAPQVGNASAIVYTRSVVVPLNGLLLHDKVADAWTWTFGREPGAKLLRTDRGAGLIEGSARVDFRSEMLMLREESMGSIKYHVLLNVSAGECRITVSELEHTGNRNTARGGVHLGRLTRALDPAAKVRGAGAANGRRLYAEVKAAADERITALLQSFEARLRASAEP